MNGRLVVENLGKSYRRYGSEWRRILSWFVGDISPVEEHWVLRNVSFSVAPGEAVGIVGQNGAGKSTLLKLITGTAYPTEGRVHIAGRIAAILELGMGFMPELTGRENTYHSVGLMGHSLAETESVIQEIWDFAEIGDAFDQPVRTYSSGMQMRLAFGVATAFRPDILIVDEALSVGDGYFQHKCMQRIRHFQESGTSLLFVSHSPEAVRTLCQRAIMLDSGLVVRNGDAASVMDYYRASLVRRAELLDSEDQSELAENVSEIPDRDNKTVLHRKMMGGVSAEILSGRTPIHSGDPMSLRITAAFDETFADPHLGFGIRNKMGITIYEANTYTLGHKTRPVRKGERLSVTFGFPARFSPGTYEIMVGVADSGYDLGSFEKSLFFDQSFMLFEVVADNPGWSGLWDLQPSVEVIWHNDAGQVPVGIKGRGRTPIERLFATLPGLDQQRYRGKILHAGKNRPVMLIVETVNICNNDCLICAYGQMTRSKQTMEMPLFAKVLEDYRAMGGGALSLTPMLGDILLDRYLPARLSLLKTYAPRIGPVSVTTNLVAADHFNDAELFEIIQSLDRVHVSIYGLDADEYLTLARKNNYEKMLRGLVRIGKLGLINKLHIGFRFLRQHPDQEIEQWLMDNLGVLVPYRKTTAFANWGVLDTGKSLPHDATWIEPREKKQPCLIPLVAMQVFSNGKVSFCHCDDFDNHPSLDLGSVSEQSLLELYSQPKVEKLWDFSHPPAFCDKCSFYKPLSDLPDIQWLFENPTEFIGG